MTLERLDNGDAFSGHLDVRTVAIEKIRRYDNNPRRNAKAVAKVRASIEEFGWRQPIVADPDGVIIIGDTRYLAAVDMGLPAVPVHYATGLTAEKIRALRIADNRTHEEADWDEEKLNTELQALLDAGADLSTTAMDKDELAKLLDEMDEPTLTKVDVTPLPSMTWVLIGIPTTRYIEIAEEIEHISAVPDVFCELTANSDDAAAPHRKAAQLHRGDRPDDAPGGPVSSLSQIRGPH